MEKVICIATPLYPPEIGGPATHIALLEQELPARGFKLRVVKFSTVRHLPKLIRHVAYYRNLLKAARGAACVYALDPVSVGFPAHLVAKRLGLPLVLRVGGDYAWEQGTQRFGVTETLDEFVVHRQSSRMVRTLQRIQSLVAASAEVVIAPSEYLGSIVETWGVKRSRISVVYSQPELPAHFPSRAEARGLLGVKSDERLVFSAGRLVPWKGFEGLVDAVASLENVRLVIAGDGPYRERLEAHIGARQMKGKVDLLGRISHEQILNWLCAADAFALNTRYEGLSHQLLEAFAARVPVVTTRVGGNTELIEDGKEGVLVTYNDTDALAQALNRVLQDRVFASELVACAHASLARFVSVRTADAIASLFKNI